MDARKIAIGTAVLAVLAIGNAGYNKAREEYGRFTRMVSSSLNRLGDGIDQAIATAKSAEKTSDSIRETIEGLRERLARLESSSLATMAAKQSEIDSLVDQLDKEQDRRAKAELDAEQATQSLKVMKQPQSVQTAGPKIVMHSGASCLPCQQWKRDVMPLWKSKGWTVEVIEESTTDRTWPWFEVFEGGRRYEVNGPLTQDSYSRVKR
jgi:preprotein translocase subunit SecD